MKENEEVQGISRPRLTPRLGSWSTGLPLLQSCGLSPEESLGLKEKEDNRKDRKEVCHGSCNAYGAVGLKLVPPNKQTKTESRVAPGSAGLWTTLLVRVHIWSWFIKVANLAHRSFWIPVMSRNTGTPEAKSSQHFILHTDFVTKSKHLNKFGKIIQLKMLQKPKKMNVTYY